MLLAGRYHKKGFMKKMAFELALKGSNNKICYFLINYVPCLLRMLFFNPHNKSKQSIITPLLEIIELKTKELK